MSDQDPLAQRRQEAKLALGGEQVAAREQELAKRRQEARTAMESEDQRNRRQTQDKVTQAGIERAAAAEAAKKAAVEAEARARAKVAAAAEAAKQAKMAEALALRERAARASKTADKIKNEDESTLSGFHTIKTDMAKAVREQGLSLSKIATISRERGEGTVISPSGGLGFGSAVAIVVLVGGGLIGWWWTAQRAAVEQNPPAPVEISNSVMRAEHNVAVATDSIAGSQALRQSIAAALATASSSAGFTNLYLTRQGELLYFSDFRQAIGLSIPEDLTRHLSDNFFYGIYDSGETRSPFLVIQTNFFDQAWSGMLAWEQEMSADLNPLLQTPATGTGTWSDKVVQNRDVRRQADQSSNTTLVYGFVNDGTIVIARNENVFTKIFERLIDQI